VPRPDGWAVEGARTLHAPRHAPGRRSLPTNDRNRRLVRRDPSPSYRTQFSAMLRTPCAICEHACRTSYMNRARCHAHAAYVSHLRERPKVVLFFVPKKRYQPTNIVVGSGTSNDTWWHTGIGKSCLHWCLEQNCHQ
jgi:hypothetical protein